MDAHAFLNFYKIVNLHDPARRGRRPGEIVALLSEGALAVGFPRNCIRCILDEDRAADACLAMAQPGDLVVLTPTDVEAMWRQVLDYRVPLPARARAEEAPRQARRRRRSAPAAEMRNSA